MALRRHLQGRAEDSAVVHPQLCNKFKVIQETLVFININQTHTPVRIIMEFSPKELAFHLKILDLRMSDHYVVFTDRNKKPRKIALVFTMWPLKCAEIIFKMFVIKAWDSGRN